MASITNATLHIESNAATGTSNCTVACKVYFTPYEQREMKEGLRFVLHSTLWGEDLGNWLNPDDYIFSYGSKYFPDASPSSPESVTFAATLGTNLLNEDFGTDEVFGKLTLRNLYTGNKVSAKTNVVKRKF